MSGHEDLERRPRNLLWRRLSLAGASLVLSVALIELVFRVAGFDFAQKGRVLADVPIYYRRPAVPFGEAFFRRDGPTEWRGKVITSMLRRHGVAESLIPNERAEVIRYDADGFRNAPDLRDWEVVVVGDSFTELGHLPQEELFTTLIGERLGLRVKNLGVSYTGTLTHVAYLAAYGGSRSARHAVLAFFEGNDIAELVRENAWLNAARNGADGAARRVSAMEAQSSFLRAIFDFAASTPQEVPVLIPNSRFRRTASEAPVSLSVNYQPPAAEQLEPRERRLLAEALNDWSQTSRSLGMTPWVLYIPAKRRVLHGYLTPLWVNPSEDEEWQPTDLPALVEALALASGSRFVDPTNALRRAAQSELPYSGLFDTHVNALGSRVIADVLGDALARADEGPEGDAGVGGRPGDVPTSDRSPPR